MRTAITERTLAVVLLCGVALTVLGLSATPVLATSGTTWTQARGGPVVVVARQAPDDAAMSAKRFNAGDITPDWVKYAAGAGAASDQAYGAAATSGRTVYTVGVIGNAAGNPDLSLIKYVDDAESWRRTYDGAYHGSDGGVAIAIARTGAIYTAGTTEVSAADLANVVVIRWRSNGTRVWTRRVDAGQHLPDTLVDVVVDRSGNVTVLFAGYSAHGDRDWFLVSYTAGGKKRWVRRYAGPARGDDAPRDLHVDGKGRLYATGYSTARAGDQDVLTAKWAVSGKRLWARRFDGPAGSHDGGHALAARPGGGVYVVGSATQVTTGTDALLLSYSAGGARKFTTIDPGFSAVADVELFYDVAATRDARIVAAGTCADHGTGFDRFLVVYDKNGDRDFMTAQSSPGVLSDTITEVAVDASGGIVLSGTWSLSGDFSQVYTQRIAGDGGLFWNDRWPTVPTGANVPHALAVKATSVFVAGATDTGGPEGRNQALLGYIY